MEAIKTFLPIVFSREPKSRVEGNVNAGSYQNYQNWTVSNQLTTLEGGSVFEGAGG